MRILWGSNSPTSPSGYGVQTDMVTRRLAKDHQVAIASNYGHQEGMMQWPTENGDIPIYPMSAGKYSADILPVHAQQHAADCVITHYDAWCYDPSVLASRWVPWFPMDCEQIPPGIVSRIQHAMMRFTQTRYSVAECERVGLDAEYVPAAFDGKAYYPRDPSIWRERQNVTDNFVVGVVAANRGDPGTPSRKSFPQIFEAFKLFLRHCPDARLYLHTLSDGHINLDMLAQQHGITDHIIKSHPYFMHCGMYKGDDMALLYSGFDVLLQPSMGEGFGVPIAEAQACGTPVIVGDWTAMSEVGRSGAKISKSDAYRYPIIGYGDMWLPDPGAICEALVESTKWPRSDEVRAKISERVSDYEMDVVWEDNWVPALRKLDRAVAEKNAPLVQPNRKSRRAQIKGKRAEVAA